MIKTKGVSHRQSQSQLLAELGDLDADVLRDGLAFMGFSEELLNQNEFQWSPEYRYGFWTPPHGLLAIQN